MRRNGGFTLIELLVVIAIIAILAAILFPVFASARESGRRTACLSNIRQISMACMMYTNANNGKLPPYRLYVNGVDTKEWYDYIAPFLKKGGVYTCPTVGNKDRSHEADSMAYRRVTGTGVPFQHVWVFLRIEAGKPLPGAEGSPSISNWRQPSKTLMLCEAYTIDASGKEVGYPVAFCPVCWPNGWLNGTNQANGYRADGNIAKRHGGGANVAFIDGHVTWKLQSDLRAQGDPDVAVYFGHNNPTN